MSCPIKIFYLCAMERRDFYCFLIQAIMASTRRFLPQCSQLILTVPSPWKYRGGYIKIFSPNICFYICSDTISPNWPEPNYTRVNLSSFFGHPIPNTIYSCCMYRIVSYRMVWYSFVSYRIVLYIHIRFVLSLVILLSNTLVREHFSRYHCGRKCNYLLPYL